MNKDQTPVPLAKDFEKLKGKLEQRKRDEPGLLQLQGKVVRIHMRDGSIIEGVITSIKTYELEIEGTLRMNTTNIIASEKRHYIIMKHAVDVIEVG